MSGAVVSINLPAACSPLELPASKHAVTVRILEESPSSRVRHLIGNLKATPLENGEVQAKTAFLQYRSHLETDHQLISGCREDLLRR
jgi:3-phenylpropionate/cinnamic acid dioxygenase small subunit